MGFRSTAVLAGATRVNPAVAGLTWRCSSLGATAQEIAAPLQPAERELIAAQWGSVEAVGPGGAARSDRRGQYGDRGPRRAALPPGADRTTAYEEARPRGTSTVSARRSADYTTAALHDAGSPHYRYVGLGYELDSGRLPARAKHTAHLYRPTARTAAACKENRLSLRTRSRRLSHQRVPTSASAQPEWYGLPTREPGEIC